MSDQTKRTCGECASFGTDEGCWDADVGGCPDYRPADAAEVPDAEPARFTAFQFCGETHQSEPVLQPPPALPDGTYRVVCGELVLVVPGVPPELGLPDAEPDATPDHHEYCSRGVGPRRDCHVCRGLDGDGMPGAGPEPASPVPWRKSYEYVGDYRDWVLYDAAGKAMCQWLGVEQGDLAAIVHRVNNYPALHAHAKRLQAALKFARELAAKACEDRGAAQGETERLQAEVGQLNECIAQWRRDCDEAWGVARADTNATRILGDKLERETKRADAAEAEAADLQRIITVWRGRHDEDHDRADKAEAEVERLRGWVARICEELYPVGRYADVSLGMALTGIVNLRHRADKAEAERDDMKRRLCAEMALRLQSGAVPHATPHSVAHGQFGLVEADRLFPRQTQEGGE